MIYVQISNEPSLYIGQAREIEQSKNNNEYTTIYYVFANSDNNSLHVIPFSLHEKKKELFLEPPTFIEEKGQHSYFSRHFNQIGLELDHSTIVFYGINKKDLCEMIQIFTYHKEADCYIQAQNKNIEYFPMFESELKKERFALVNEISN